MFPSPHPGIINFFTKNRSKYEVFGSFRPLIRGLSISSYVSAQPVCRVHVSVPSSGDYQFLQSARDRVLDLFTFPSPHPGIINFFDIVVVFIRNLKVSVPSSGDYQFLRGVECVCLVTLFVSVPSSGDYQFLLYVETYLIPYINLNFQRF